MSGGIKLKIGFIFSLIAGILNLLSSRSLSWSFYAFPISLLILSGVLLIVISGFVLIDPKHHVIWGATLLFSAALGFVAIGIAGVDWLLPWPSLFILVLGVVEGALGIAQK